MLVVYKGGNMAKSNGAEQYLRGLWWMWLLAGVVSIVFGLVATFWPGLTLVVAIQLAAFFVLMWGIFELVIGLSKAGDDKFWWAQSLVGIAMTVLGIFLVKHLDLGLAAFALVLGWTLLARGVVDAAIGYYLDQPGKAWWWLSAVLGIVAGIVMWMYPAGAGVAYMWVLGLYALINGSVIVSRALTASAVYRESVAKK